MAKRAATEQYVLLPARGLRARATGGDPEAREFLLSAEPSGRAQTLTLDGRRAPISVVDSIGPDGAKLVEATPEAVLALRAVQPGLRLVPVVYYTTADVGPPSVIERPTVTKAAAGPATITLTVVSQADKAPIAGAFVVAFTDFAAQRGAQGVTDGKGQLKLQLGGSSVKLERLYVYPVTAFWTLLKKGFTVSSGTQVALRPLDLGYEDALRHFYGRPADSVGKGVTVGVIDTGVAKHPDLAIAGGANTVPGEEPGDFGDNGQGHGTHVAGIVAARGQPPKGIRGVAPGVTLRAYRVFGKGSKSASSFAIAKAIDQAVADRCDLLNMSLGGGAPDEVLRAAVDDARAGGSVCIIAAGNADRSDVSFPANLDSAVAVSAMGRKGTFPAGVAEADDVAPPYGTDKKDFIASFSNVGPAIDLTGPGVAIMSTYPNGYAEISGTSMACPAVTGAAARVLTPNILRKKRNAARSAAIVKALLASAKSLGFQPPFEGHGLPEPG
jgi:subtilisin